MLTLLDLALPILLSTIAGFFASFLAWAVLPHHTPDISKHPKMDDLTGFVRDNPVPAGQYMFPVANDSDQTKPEEKEKFDKGPWGLLVIWPGKPNMLVNVALTISFFFIVSLGIGHALALALPAGAGFGRVFHLAAVISVMTHTMGAICNQIWFPIPVRAKVLNFVDGTVYGLITALLFAVLWPGA